VIAYKLRACAVCCTLSITDVIYKDTVGYVSMLYMLSAVESYNSKRSSLHTANDRKRLMTEMNRHSLSALRPSLTDRHAVSFYTVRPKWRTYTFRLVPGSFYGHFHKIHLNVPTKGKYALNLRTSKGSEIEFYLYTLTRAREYIGNACAQLVKSSLHFTPLDSFQLRFTSDIHRSSQSNLDVQDYVCSGILFSI
jgi:hypothetical protein